MQMNTFETFALKHFLSGYPEGLPFGIIIEMIHEHDDNIIRWYPFEEMDDYEFITAIYALCNQLENTFTVKHDHANL